MEHAKIDYFIGSFITDQDFVIYRNLSWTQIYNISEILMSKNIKKKSYQRENLVIWSFG